MADLTELMTADIPCFDPECAGMGEPESEGDLSWFTCEVCNSEYGYERIPQTQASENSCQLGVPESVRRIGSAMGDPGQLEQPSAPTPVLVTIGKK